MNLFCLTYYANKWDRTLSLCYDFAWSMQEKGALTELLALGESEGGEKGPSGGDALLGLIPMNPFNSYEQNILPKIFCFFSLILYNF